MEIGIHTTEPDKFCAYDPKTDSAYCINDNFEIVKFSFAALDWTVNLIGQPATDDDGLAILNHELSIGGSHVARVDRKIYSLCGWEQGSTLATRSYLAWYDIDTQQRGLIRCPFDIDDEYFVANAPDFGGRNPEESAGLVALHRHLVVIRVYNPRPAGYPCMWSYDVDRKQWTSGELPPFTTYSRTWVALPFDNSVMFFGVQGDANEAYFALRTVFKYRVF